MNDYEESKLTFEEMNPDYNKWDRVLYIGWHPKTFNSWKGYWFIEHINSKRNTPAKVFIIEKDKNYYEALKNHDITKEYEIEPILGDINEFPIKDKFFNLIIWWHGPEHVTESELISCINKFEEESCDIILGGPLGHDDYHDPNSDDKHLCELTEEMFTKLGYDSIIVNRDARGQVPHISAWKIK